MFYMPQAEVQNPADNFPLFLKLVANLQTEVSEIMLYI